MTETPLHHTRSMPGVIMRPVRQDAPPRTVRPRVGPHPGRVSFGIRGNRATMVSNAPINTTHRDRT